jgi:prolyl-tRNA synthetase
MKFTEGLVKTKKDVAKQIDSANAELLIKGSYIEQVMAGVYNYLPLGLRVIRKIEEIIRQEMIEIGGNEVLMPVLQPKENWQKTGRWDELDTLYRFESYYSKSELVLGPTHEEIVVPMAHNFIQSYKDLPKYLFQIQTKFRDEKRAKGGLLRAKEFIMKDLYSFHTDEKDLDDYYEKAKKAYVAIFDRIGLGKLTYLTFASGGTFSKYSHEFQTISESGEDNIYLCEKCDVAVNKEIIDEQKVCPECGKKDFKIVKAIEVGNIFKLRTKYSEKFNLTYTDETGKEKLVEMGCYGIGVGRLMGALVEVFHDDKGIIWPDSVAPFTVHLINLGEEKKVYDTAGKLYEDLTKAGIEVIWDDREESAGTKFADADLVGVPYRLVVSEKTCEKESVELKSRDKKETELIKLKEVINKIKG